MHTRPEMLEGSVVAYRMLTVGAASGQRLRMATMSAWCKSSIAIRNDSGMPSTAATAPCSSTGAQGTKTSLQKERSISRTPDCRPLLRVLRVWAAATAYALRSSTQAIRTLASPCELSRRWYAYDRQDHPLETEMKGNKLKTQW